MLRIILFFLIAFHLPVFSQTKLNSFQKNLVIDTTGRVSICLGDSVVGKVFLEYFKWNRWVAIDSVEKKRQGYDSCYFSHVDLFVFKSFYRVSSNGADGKRIAGESVVIQNHTDSDTCWQLTNVHVTTSIVLKCPAAYEIYDSSGNVIKKGYGQKVDVSNLIKGGYFIETYGKTQEFFKQ